MSEHEWIPVTRELLDARPDWLDSCWIAVDGKVVLGEYVWEQGRNPDRFVTIDGRDLWAFRASHVQPCVIPTLPKIEDKNAKS